jgi:hypothetical protein
VGDARHRRLQAHEVFQGLGHLNAQALRAADEARLLCRILLAFQRLEAAGIADQREVLQQGHLG